MAIRLFQNVGHIKPFRTPHVQPVNLVKAKKWAYWRSLSALLKNSHYPDVYT